MSALARSVAKLRADVAALRSACDADGRVERVVGDSWLTSGFSYEGPSGLTFFVGDMAPTHEAWEAAFAHLRYRARDGATSPALTESGSGGAGTTASSGPTTSSVAFAASWRAC